MKKSTTRRAATPATGHGHFIPCVSYVNSVIDKPGVLAVRFPGMTSLGELDCSMTTRIDLLIKTFERAGISVELRSDIRVYLWEKLAAFCGFAGVEVLTRLPAGEIRECPETNVMWVRASNEVEEVARAVGVTLADDYLDRPHELVDSVPATRRPSMYYDFLAMASVLSWRLSAVRWSA